MFIPTTSEEIKKLGWNKLDIILITGDTYIDSSYIGVAVIGKVLINAGFKVGIIAQPDISDKNDISRLGIPKLFWGVTGGCMDSMVSNYTASNKRRQKDDLTPGRENNRRPDLAVIAYTNLIRRYYKDARPIIIGGIEASLRRISHYHFWTNKVRRSILFDARADVLVYGMGEKTILELAEKISKKEDITEIKGICYIGKIIPEEYIELPAHEEVVKDKYKFTKAFKIFYQNTDPLTARGFYQKQDTRYLIHNPPQESLTNDELDNIYELDFERDVHPYYKKLGQVRALDTIRYSITSHRGCYGECNFCAISVHQGRMIIERSESSIIREAECITKEPDFKGIINDVGGPTANMYGIECLHKTKRGACRDKRCMAPVICKKLRISHKRQINLLKRLRSLPGVKKVFIGSGIRHDLILKDKAFGSQYLKEISAHHISGQLKIAPEHSEDSVLDLMGKPGAKTIMDFKRQFDKINSDLGKKQYLTCYFIAAHPGCTVDDMFKLKLFIKKILKFNPEQVQIFTPTPSTYSTLMYYTEADIKNGQSLFVEKNRNNKEKQKNIVIKKK
ncbi:YgiQ family radical SAM protein [Desulfobacterales bacterium HSG17]|nr:YgiQ family radical SAM protein [Desulfobacterales bacterium HSG17]